MQLAANALLPRRIDAMQMSSDKRVVKQHRQNLIRHQYSVCHHSRCQANCTKLMRVRRGRTLCSITAHHIARGNLNTPDATLLEGMLEGMLELERAGTSCELRQAAGQLCIVTWALLSKVASVVALKLQGALQDMQAGVQRLDLQICGLVQITSVALA